MVELAPFELLRSVLAWLFGFIGVKGIISVSAVMTAVALLYGIHKAYWLAHLGRTASRYALVSLLVAGATIGVLMSIGVFPTVSLDPLAEVLTP